MSSHVFVQRLSPSQTIMSNWSRFEVEYFAFTAFKDRFKDIIEIDSGSDGQIFSGIEKATGNEVAIKVVPTDCGASEGLRREAEVYAALKRTGVREDKGFAKLYYFGMCGRTHEALIMTIMKENLQEFFERKDDSLSTEQVLALGRQILNRIERLHLAGYVHHDLHEGNVMLDAEGVVHLIDFGRSERLQKPGEGGSHERRSVLSGFLKDLHCLYTILSGYFDRKDPSKHLPSQVLSYRNMISSGCIDKPGCKYDLLRSCLKGSQ